MDGEVMADTVVGTLVALLGFVGFFMAVFARDIEIFIFGGSLLAFTIVFVGGIARRGWARRSGVDV